MELIEKRRAKWLAEAVRQLNVRETAVVVVDGASSAAWIRGELRRFAREAGTKIRTGTHPADGTVWATINIDREVSEAEHRAAAEAISRAMRGTT